MCVDMGEVHTFGKGGFTGGHKKGGSREPCEPPCLRACKMHHRRDCQTSADSEDHLQAQIPRIPFSVMQAPVHDHCFIRLHNQHCPIQHRLSSSWDYGFANLSSAMTSSTWLRPWLVPRPNSSSPSNHNRPMHRTPPIASSTGNYFCPTGLFVVSL